MDVEREGFESSRLTVTVDKPHVGKIKEKMLALRCLATIDEKEQPDVQAANYTGLGYNNYFGTDDKRAQCARFSVMSQPYCYAHTRRILGVELRRVERRDNGAQGRGSATCAADHPAHVVRVNTNVE